MTNKLLKFLLIIALLMPLPVLASTPLQVYVDDLPLSFDVPPLIQEGRVLVPFRKIAERLHLNVEWEEKTQTVKASSPTTTLLLKIGSKIAVHNDQEIELDVPPQIIEARTLIPLRFFGETFENEVAYQAGMVKIKTPPQKMLVSAFYALGSKTASSWTNLFTREYPETNQGHTDLVGEIALGWYSLDKEGNLLTRSTTGWQKPSGWLDVLTAAKKYDLHTEMVVHLTDTNSQLSNLIANPHAVEKAVKNIAQAAAHYDGVNLDFEGLGWRESGETLRQTQINFTRFVKQLAEKLPEHTLTLTLHPLNSAYLGYDYEALNHYCDTMIIMAYDYGPKPEPIKQVNEAIEKALTFVPPQKLILGISLPSETAASLPAKIGLVKAHNLKGIALWRLGLVTPEMWSVLKSEIKLRM